MIWKFMLEGGWCMVPIVACSVVGLALILERAWYWVGLRLRRDDGLRRDLLALDLDDARVAASGDPFCHAVHRLLKAPGDPAVATTYVESVLRETKESLPVLNIIAGVSCSLGLIGTVLGVSLAFEALARGRAEELALALSVALNTTVLGLIVYLPVYIASSVYVTLSNRLGFEIEQGLNQAQIRLRARALERAGEGA